MKDSVAIFDTYVKNTDSEMMHFDIVVPKGTEVSKVYDFGRKYLTSKNVQASNFSSKLCTFCHVEEPTAQMKQDIKENGFHIIEMAGCN